MPTVNYAATLFFQLCQGGGLFHTGKLNIVNTSFGSNKAGQQGTAVFSIGNF